MSADHESNSSQETATNDANSPEMETAHAAESEQGKQNAGPEPVIITGNLRTGELDKATRLALVEGPKDGKLTLNADGSFIFEPGADLAADGEFISITFTFQFVDDSGQVVTRKAVLSGTAQEFDISTMTEAETLATQLRLLLEDETGVELELEFSAEDGITPEQLAEELKLAIAQRQAFDFVEFSFRNVVSLGGGGTVSVDDIVSAILSGDVELPDDVVVTDRSNETNATEITGTAGNDIIVAGAGGDTVGYQVGQGNDTVDGGAGFDLVSVDLSALDDDDADPSVPVAPRNVAIRAVNGNVVLDGGDFELTLNGVEEILLTGGNAGGSFVIGDLTGTDIADDTIIILGGNGTINVVNESDRSLEVRATPGNDTIIGGSSTDLIIGLNGNDSLVGGGGNDTLGGGAGKDTLEGGAGDDTLDYTISDVILGGSGSDTLQVFGNSIDIADLVAGGSSGIERINFISGRSDFVVIERDAANSLTDGNVLRVDGGAEDIVFLSASDNWSDSGTSGSIRTFTSNGFTLEVQTGVQVITVGAGDSRPNVPGLPTEPQVSGGGDPLYPTIPNPVTLFSGQFDDGPIRSALELALNNTIVGDVATLISRFNAVLDAAKQLGDAFSGTTAYSAGTSTDDILNYNAPPVQGPNVNFSDPALYANLVTGIQEAVLDLAINIIFNALTSIARSLVGGPHIAFGGDGNDQLSGDGGSWDDYLNGGSGADTMRGGKGNDTYIVDNSSDVVTELSGQGTDSIVLVSRFGYAMPDHVENLFGAAFGVTGNDQANYIEGTGPIIGGGGNDTLNATGSSILAGGAGADLLFGSSSDDGFIFDEQDIIYENENGGTDTLFFRGFANPANNQTVDLGAIEAAGRLFGTIENITLDNAGVNSDLALNFNAVGNQLDNFIRGNAGNNRLEGRDGDDTLIGGPESLQGADGFDTLEGGNGDDVYLVSDLNDTIFDIGGVDTIRIFAESKEIEFGSFNYVDRTFTYELPTDSVIENLEFGEVTLSAVDQRVLDQRNDPISLQQTGRSPVEGPNQDFNALGGLGNNRITGNSGDNTFTARGGNDTLIGGSGNDTLIADSGTDTAAGEAGDSSLVGGVGDDTYVLYRDGDVVVEEESQGTDTITSSVVSIDLNDYATAGSSGLVSSNVESVILTGSLDLNATGDNADNTIQGNAGDNVLVGGLGNDRIVADNDTSASKVLNLLPTAVVNYLKFSDAQGNYDFQAALDAIQASLPSGVSLPEGNAEDVIRAISERSLLLARADLVISKLSDAMRAEFFNGEFTRGDVAPQDFRVLVDELSIPVSLSTEIFDQVLDRILTTNGSRTKSQIDQVIDATPSSLIDALVTSGFSQSKLRSRLEDAVPDGLTLGDGDLVTILQSIITTAQSQLAVDEAQAKLEITDAFGSELTQLFNRMADAIADTTSSFSGLFDELTRDNANRTDQEKASLVFAVNNFFDLDPTTLLNQLSDQALFDLIFRVANRIADSGNSINNGVNAEVAAQRLDVVIRLNNERINNETSETAIDHLASLVRANNLGFKNGVDSVSEAINEIQNSGDVFVGQAKLLFRIMDILPADLDLPLATFTSITGTALEFAGLSLTSFARVQAIADRAPFIRDADLINRIITDDLYAQFESQFASNPLNAPLGFRQLLSANFGDQFNDQSLALYQQIRVFRGDAEQTNDSFNKLDPIILVLPPDVLADLFGRNFDEIGDSLTSLISSAIDGRVTVDGGITDAFISDLRQLIETPHSDILRGGAGDDTFVIGSADDAVIEQAGEGNDTVISNLNGYTLTANVENLILDNGVIEGTGSGTGGFVRGNALDNYLISGAGSERLEGGAGNDVFLVNDTTDEVTDSSGIDQVLSTATFTLGAGIENLNLLGGANINGTGNAQDNVILGNAGNNSLDGGDGADSLLGGLGNDTLFGGEDFAVDTLKGGEGDDTYVINTSSAGSADFKDVISDSGGSDTVVLPGVLVIDSFVLPNSIENITVTGTGAVDFNGNAFSNRLTGNASGNIIRGGLGNDTLIGGGGDDFLFGEDNDDFLEGAHMFGGSGNDTYKVTDAGFLIVDTSGTDAVESTVTFTQDVALRTELIALLDESTITTRSTADLLADAQQKADAGSFSSTKALSFQDFIAALPSLELGEIEKITLVGDAAINATGADTNEQIIGNDANNQLIGNGGNDALTGNGGDDTLSGGAGSDTLLGGDGNDSLDGGSDNDTLEGGAGNDTLVAGNGTDRVVGGAGDDVHIIDQNDTAVEDADGGTDTISGDFTIDLANFANFENATLRGSGNLNLTGDSNANVLTGNSGANTLIGGGGNDTLIGGAGNDTYLVTDGVTISEGAGGGSDTVQVSTGLDLADGTFTNIENATLLDGGGAVNLSGDSANNVLTGNSSANVLDGRGGDDTLTGGDGGDTYIVDSFGDVVNESGTSGTDTVQSSVTYTIFNTAIENLTLTGTGNIDASGSTGNNILTGNAGNNAFFGGGGNDQMSGGAGDDTFNIESFDTIVELAEFRVEENQTLVADLSTLFASLPSSPNFQLFEQSGASGDRTPFSLDPTTGILTFNNASDFENAQDADGDNVYRLSVQAEQFGLTINFLVKVTDDTIEGVTTLAGAGNEEVTKLFVDGTNLLVEDPNTTFAIESGGDTFQVDSLGRVSFINTQTAASDTPRRVEVKITKDGVSNIVAIDVTVADNSAGRADIARSQTVNGTPVKDISKDTAIISNPTTAVTLADNVENLTLDTTDAETLNGNSRDNVITGNTGNDTLDGKAGTDTLKGGAGNDTYVVDANDVIEELTSGGTDTVNASESYTISTNIENLTLTGSANINGTGNNDANTITGNTGNNNLSGLLGNDTLIGNAGNDTLDGGAGNDSMRGGTGDDTYVVDTSFDVIDEGLNQGNDTVQTSLNNFSLASLAGIENLTFTSTDANTGTGNAANNTIIGNSGNDTLDGAAGNDRLEGKGGDDTFTVDSSSDTVVENANEGTDTVNASATFTLGANVENLTLTGSANINGTGNTLANVITGNSGNNNLSGLGGDDTFVYTVADSANDTISGGDGTDTLNLTGSNLSLDLGTVTNMTSIEVVNFAGTGAHTLTVDETSITNIAGGTLKVLGDSADSVVAKGDWTLLTDNSTDSAGRTIDIYQLGSTDKRLQVQDGVDVRIVNPQPVISVQDIAGGDVAGVVLQGSDNDHWRKIEVGSAGDLDGDGFDDVVVGLDYAYTSYDSYGYDAGRAFVVFGADSFLGTSVNLDALNGTDGFSVDGRDSGALGSGISAGDFNGDGIDDLLVSDKGAGYNYSSFEDRFVSASGREGITYLIYGDADNSDGSSNFAASIDAYTLQATGVADDGAAFRPRGAGADSGENVANIGDFNGDGIDDFVVSGNYRGIESQREGGAYIVFGTANGFDGTIDLENLNGSNGLEITARGYTNDQIGFNVESAGDVNGDGFDDVIMTSYGRSYATHVIFGTDTGVREIDVGDLDNTNGFQLFYGGADVSGGGDINGDGFDDLVITSKGTAAWVLFGDDDLASVLPTLRYDGGYYTSNNLYALDPGYGGDGSLGFRIQDSGGTDYFGSSVSIIGDVNGDGFDDILIGDYYGTGSYDSVYERDVYAGQAFVVFGGATGHGGNLDVSTLDGNNGFKIDGGTEYLGYAVSGAGDVNGDGFDDFIVAERGVYAYNDNPYIETEIYNGAAYLIFGKDFAGAAGTIGSIGDDTLSGGTDSVLRGGAGDDEIRITATDFFRIDGGGGNDTLVLDGSGLSLNFDDLSRRSIQDIENIDISGSGGNTLTIDHLQASKLLGTGRTLQITGGADDTVILPTGSVVGTDGANNTYTRNGVTISISNTVTVNQVDFAPTIVTGNAFTVNENTTAVADLHARDRNGDSITYSITGGADQSFFSIDSTTGELSFLSAPDFEDPQGDVPGAPGANDNTYEVVVTATDDSGGTLAASQTITVTVDDVNEAPSITISSGNNVNFIANASGLTGITFATSDPENEAVTLTLTGADVDGTNKFFLSAGTNLQAALTVSPATFPADADGDGVYELTLTATDASGNVTTENLFIGVGNDGGVNGVPVFDEGTPTAVTIVEGETAVGTFTAFDVEGSAISYSLTGADDDADFSIDSSTGVLTLNSAKTYQDSTVQDANTYRVTITASDGTDTRDLVLDVTVAYNVTATPATLTNFNSNFSFLGNADVPEENEILDFSNLLEGVGGPTDMQTAFDEGWINLKQESGQTIVQFDSDGGGDDYVDILTIENGGNRFISEADLELFNL